MQKTMRVGSAAEAVSEAFADLVKRASAAGDFGTRVDAALDIEEAWEDLDEEDALLCADIQEYAECAYPQGATA